MAQALSLVAQLRRRIKDERPSRTALRFACDDEAASDCLVNISDSGMFTTTTFNSREAADLSIDLSETPYNTVRKLAEYLQQQAGYAVTLEQDFEAEHPAVDLQIVGSMSVLRTAVSLKHHIFSNEELLEVLTKACTRHNISYTPTTLPRNEEELVLMLAHVDVNRRLAQDAAKRRNLELTVEQILQIATDIEWSYADTVKRQQRVIPTPKFDEGLTEQGDVVIGTFVKRSMRSGFFSPMAGGLPPTKPILELPSSADVEDTKVRITWRRNTDLNFYSYELWRDTVPDVVRPKSLQLITDGPSLLRDQVKQPFTSKLVFRSYGSHSNKDNIGWATFIEQAGQLITEFIDVGSGDGGPTGALTAPPLEPEMTYYYRLYTISLNYEVSESNVIAVKTKPMRAKMSSPSPITPTSGPAGTTVTVTGEGFTGLTSGPIPGSVTLGGKPVSGLVIVSDTKMTFTVPTFQNQAYLNVNLDLVVTSPVTGLKDVYAQGFRYTA